MGIMVQNYHEHRKGRRLIDDLKSGKIKRDDLSNHGEVFNRDYEQLYFEKFILYLSSTSRYIMNHRLRERAYDGE